MAASDGDKDGYEDKKDDLALIAEAKAFYTEDAAYEDITKDKQEPVRHRHDGPVNPSN